MDTINKILQKKAATISLNELAEFSHASDYGEFVEEINSLIGQGLLRVFGKETNGKFPPLAARYRICRPAADASSARDEILRLGPGFNPSGYLANIPLYNKHRELVQRLHDYARNKSGELNSCMSKNERAYAIWGNEKQLDDAACKSMLRFTGWESKLNYYDTPEPFWDYLVNGADTKCILVLENKDIWFSLRKLLMENKAACLLYGQWFDGILYGEGKKIARSGALSNYAEEGFHKPPSFYYWGDLDYEGINIYLMIASFPVRLFVPAYLAMLDHAKTQNLTQIQTMQVAPGNIGEFLQYFSEDDAAEIKSILGSGKYIPQEICSYPRLKAAWDKTAVEQNGKENV
jgi:hypothetical protein